VVGPQEKTTPSCAYLLLRQAHQQQFSCSDQEKKPALGKGLKRGTGEGGQLFALWPVAVIAFDMALFPSVWKENLWYG